MRLCHGKTYSPHLPRGEQGLRLETPVIVVDACADGRVRGDDLVVAHQALTDRFENALDQIRLVRQQEAQLFKADDLDDIFEDAAWA